MPQELEDVLHRVAGLLLMGARGQAADQARGLPAEFAEYLMSPGFEQLALQAGLTRDSADTASLREQLRHQMRLRAAEPTDELVDLVLDQLLNLPDAILPPSQRAILAHGTLPSAGARNAALLAGIADLHEIKGRIRQLRSQIARLHATIRIPHAGPLRSVPWEQLYVPPSLSSTEITVAELTRPGSRNVILGDPGAGKSTFAEKLVHDLAAAPDGELVPLLVVLRNFATALREHGRRTMVDHLIAVGRDPYNVVLSASTVEYLLLNGHGVVVFDGLDELTDVSLRSRVAEFLRGFVLLYPLVPVIVTSRRVGYDEAPLERALFPSCGLAPFGHQQVETYVRHWFALDDGSPPADRRRLGTAFLRESRSIDDLRRSPLLLGVLCAMYSADHYIPGNRGEIYERCALMVYERWDRMRGIPRALGFEGRVRGAVQSLAWELFNGGETERPRRQILRLIRDHLIGKGFDEDQADEAAAAFLDYCAGRAWVLAEVGSTATEPIYGFAHRTFLEYFAAEYLVRRHPAPAGLWAVLRPQVERNAWEMVGRVSLQLINRNVDDGADEVLGLAVGAAFGTTVEAREPLTAFCARSLADVDVTPQRVEQVVALAVEQVCRVSVEERTGVVSPDRLMSPVTALDDALHAAMYRCLPDNLPFVRSGLERRLGELITAGVDVAVMLALSIGRPAPADDSDRAAVWTALATTLREQHGPLIDSWIAQNPVALLREGASPLEILDRWGPLPLYQSDIVLNNASPSWVARTLHARPLPAVAHEVREALLRTHTPWLPREGWRDGTTWPAPSGPRPADEDLITRYILTLPGREHLGGVQDQLPPPAVTPPHVLDFVNAWASSSVRLVSRRPLS